MTTRILLPINSLTLVFTHAGLPGCNHWSFLVYTSRHKYSIEIRRPRSAGKWIPTYGESDGKFDVRSDGSAWFEVRHMVAAEPITRWKGGKKGNRAIEAQIFSHLHHDDRILNTIPDLTCKLWVGRCLRRLKLAGFCLLSDDLEGEMRSMEKAYGEPMGHPADWEDCYFCAGPESPEEVAPKSEAELEAAESEYAWGVTRDPTRDEADDYTPYTGEYESEPDILTLFSSPEYDIPPGPSPPLPDTPALPYPQSIATAGNTICPAALLATHGPSTAANSAQCPAIAYTSSEVDLGANVERIVESRITPFGREFRVKWAGIPSALNSWEPEARVRGARAALHDFCMRRMPVAVRREGP